MTESWDLNEDQRADVIQRVTANICSLCFLRGVEISEIIAASAAISAEKKAYTAASVAARTTTGLRPIAETTTAYARKLGELVLQIVQQGGKTEDDSYSSADAEELNLTGSRDFLTKESTQDVLKALLAQGSRISKVKFSTKSFGRDAANVAASALHNVSATLTDADMSDIIAGRPEDEALDALRIISKALTASKLRNLNLSDNALGEKGVRACAEAITSQDALEGLSLQNVGCSINACKAVEELLTKTQALKQVHLFNNMSDNEGAEHIATVLTRAPMMEDFRMASSRVGPRGGIALCKGLMAGTCLVKLDISDNPMTSEIAQALAVMLQQQRKLRVLNLNDTSLAEGVAVVCQSLTTAAPELEELGLALNEITPETARWVALALHNKNKLTKLNLRENELEDRGACAIAQGLSHGACGDLRVVDLCGNQIRRVGATAMAQACVGKAGLELLALDENEISDAGIDQVKSILAGAGKEAALGPLDENDADGEDDEDDEVPEEDTELTAIIKRMALSL